MRLLLKSHAGQLCDFSEVRINRFGKGCLHWTWSIPKNPARMDARMTTSFGQQSLNFGPGGTQVSDQSPIEMLGAVDWAFPERISRGTIEAIHPYPAKFIAEIPRALIEALPPPPGTAVLDPFCGSGTTLVECQRRGIPSIGIDLNPIACLMSRVKTAPYPTNLQADATTVIERARRRPASAIPPIPNLDHWFERSIQERLAALREAIDLTSEATRDLLLLALSSIIVRVSNQESDTRYAAISKNVAAEMVPALFLRAVDRIGTVLRERAYPIRDVQIIEANTLEVRPDQIAHPIGLAVTSPPYPNAYEYWLYHKYRMWWLGFDPLSVKEQEIGARAHFFKKNHHTAEDFVRQMRQTFALLERVVVPGGHACFVVGRSRIHGQIIDNAKIIREAGSTHGFQEHFATERVLSSHRKSFNLSHANIKTETVLVFQKEYP